MMNQKRVIRKYNRKNPMENNKHLSAFAKKASRSAISTSFAAGVPVVYIKEGQLVREHPDHRIEVLGEVNHQPFDLMAYLCQD